MYNSVITAMKENKKPKRLNACKNKCIILLLGTNNNFVIITIINMFFIFYAKWLELKIT